MNATDPSTAEGGECQAMPKGKTSPKGVSASMGVKPFLLIAGLAVILDQASKLLVRTHIQLYQSITVIPGFFNLTHVRNPGGAFGFMAAGSQGLRTLLFVGVSAVAMALIVYFYRQTPKSYPYLAAALAMIFGGAVGNLIDRLRYGAVVDFLDVHVGVYHWPAFNVADSAITVGIAIFILHVVLGKMPK